MQSAIGSIPVTLDFANILNLNVLLLPVGRGDDGTYLSPVVKLEAARID